MTLQEQKKELVKSMISVRGLTKDEKFKAFMHNTTVSVKLDQIEHFEKQAQSVREFLFELAAEKGITKQQFRRRNAELLMDTEDLQLIELRKQNKLEEYFKF